MSTFKRGVINLGWGCYSASLNASLYFLECELNKHQRIIGYLYAILGAFILVVVSSVYANNADVDVYRVMPAIGIGVLEVIAGYGLISNRGWRNLIAIPVSVLGLLSVPFGTALSIYYFWYYRKHEPAKIYQARADSH